MKFITDGALGKLAKWLRILGYDTVYCPSSSVPEMIKSAITENRVILTRNTRIGEYKEAKNYILIKADFLAEQLKQLVNQLNLDINREPFRRCLICNTEIEPAAKVDIKTLVPTLTYQNHENFFRCPGCKKVYWRGTHFRNTQLKLLKMFPHQ